MNTDKTLEELEKEFHSITNKTTTSISKQKNIFDEILVEMSGLNDKETSLLLNLDEFKEVDSLYKTAFDAFLMEKYRQEFINTELGNEAVTKLLNTIRMSKSKIREIQSNEAKQFEEFLKLKEQGIDFNKLISKQNDNNE